MAISCKNIWSSSEICSAASLSVVSCPALLLKDFLLFVGEYLLASVRPAMARFEKSSSRFVLNKSKILFSLSLRRVEAAIIPAELLSFRALFESLRNLKTISYKMVAEENEQD